MILADLFEVDVRELIDGERRSDAVSGKEDGIKKAMEYGIEKERIMIEHIILTVVLGIASWIVSLIASLLFIDEVRGGVAVIVFSLVCFVLYSLCMLSSGWSRTARGLISTLIGGFSAVTVSNLLVILVFFREGSYHNYGIVGLWYALGIFIAVFLSTAVAVSLMNRRRARASNFSNQKF